MDLREAFGDYRYYLQMNEHRSPRTIASYTADLKRYIAYLEEMGIHAPQQISETDVQDYLIERSEESRPATVSRTLSSLRSFHRFLSLQQPGTLDPTRFLKGPHAALHLPRYLSRTQIEKILNSFGKEDLDIFHQAILELLYGCGLRVSECCGLRLNQVHVKQHVLRISGKGDKERMVPLHEEGMRVLQQYLRLVRPSWEKKAASLCLSQQPGQSAHTPICPSDDQRCLALPGHGYQLFRAQLPAQLCYASIGRRR